MKKKVVMLLTAVATCATLMMACGNTEAAVTDETAVETPAEDANADAEAPAEKADAENADAEQKAN